MIGKGMIRKGMIGKGTPNTPEASAAYEKGILSLEKRTPEALSAAVEFFEKSVKLDPGFAKGYAGLAEAFVMIADNHYDDPEVCFAKAKRYGLQALSLDDSLAEPHKALGIISIIEHDLGKGEVEFRRAIELNPNYLAAHYQYYILVLFQKRFSEAWAELERMLEIAPKSPLVNTTLAFSYYWRKEFSKGVELAREIIESNPSYSYAYLALIFNCIRASMIDEALRATEAYAALVSQSEAKIIRVVVDARTGRKEEARKILLELEEAHLKEHVRGLVVSPYGIASVHFILGENDEGFEWLQKGYESYERGILEMAIDYDLDGVRSDPRYAMMLTKVGLAGRIRG